MLVLSEKSSLLNLQCLSVGKNYIHSLIGRYAFVNVGPHRSFICRIWEKSDLRSDYCILDQSVELCRNSSYLFSELGSTNHINNENIEIIHKVSPIKSISVLIVFCSPWERLKWNENVSTFVDSLRDLLKLFILASNSIIHLNRFKEFTIFGIHCIRILSGVKDVGRVIKTTKIKIESQISLNTYTQFHGYPLVENDFHKEAYEEIKLLLNERRRVIVEKSEKKSFSNSLFHQQFLVIGPGGCGKSTLLNKICYDNDIVALTLDVTEIFSLKYEERASYFNDKLKVGHALSSEVKSKLCMIIIKRIDNVVSRSGKLVRLLNNFLEDAAKNPNIIVVATTDSPNSLDSSLRSANKFSMEIYLGIPNEEERCTIIEKLNKVELNQVSCLKLSRYMPGYVISDIVLVIRKALKIIKSMNLVSDEDKLNVMIRCIKNVQPASVKGIGLVQPNDNYSMNDIGGLDNIKDKLIQTIVWPIMYSDSFKRLNIPSPSGILLYGPPGCAKTSLVRAAASSCRTTFLSVSAADLYSPFVGDAEKTITQLFQRARLSAPTVLFIDEIDALVGSRSYREKGVQERILSSFLTELDGVGFNKDSEHCSSENYSPTVIVIAATNRPQVVDSALLRPGRLDKLIYVPPPSKSERLNILSKVTQNLQVDSQVSLLTIAENTENYSGADLVNLCREAGLNAITVGGTEVSCINQDHFNHALSNLKPSLSSRQIFWYSTFKFG